MSITNYSKYLKLKATAILSPDFMVRVSGSDDWTSFLLSKSAKVTECYSSGT